MKTITFFIALLMVFFQAIAQDTIQNKKNANQSGSYDKIRKGFYDKWSSFNTDNGYYLDGNKRKKIPGYKQFKRWEYVWERKADLITGSLPSIDAHDMIAAAGKRKSMAESTIGKWTNIGISDSKDVGRLNCLAFHPENDQVIYVGAPAGGLWKTTDGGLSWECLTDDLPILGVSSIVIVPAGDHDIIYIGTGDRDGRDTFSAGVLKSDDGGVSWEATALNFNVSDAETVNCLKKHPSSDQVIYAATSAGLYITVDGGSSWPLVYDSAFIDLEFHPEYPSHIYGSTRNDVAGNSYIMRSLNAGNTWEIIYISGTSSRIEMAVSPDKPNQLWAVVAEDNGSLDRVLNFTNGGNAFTTIFFGATKNLLGWSKTGTDFAVGQGSYDLALAVNPDDADHIFVGGINTWYSSNGGYDWELENFWINDVFRPKNHVHADKHFLEFQNGTSILYECNDGGLYKRTDAKKWTSLSKGLVISQMYKLGLNPRDKDEFLAGLQDNGSYRHFEGEWKEVEGGDGMECVIDHQKPAIQYASLYHGDIRRTPIRWKGLAPYRITQDTDGNPKNGLDETGSWVTPYSMDREDHKTLYLGLNNIWISDNKGKKWERISDWGDNNAKVTILSVSPSDPLIKYAYAHYEDPVNSLNDVTLFYRSDGDSDSWDNLSVNLPVSGSIMTSLLIKDDNPDEIWASFGGYNDHRVYYSENGGVNWINVSDGLPEIPVYCLVQNTMNESEVELYAGADDGVYVKRGSADWEIYAADLPNVMVYELEFDYNWFTGISTLYAATYGRGMWVTEILNEEIDIWTGAVGSDWTLPLNWQDHSIPNSETSVLIPENCTNWPEKSILSLGDDCRNLYMHENTILTVNQSLIIGQETMLKCEPSSTLNIGGSWYNLNEDEDIDHGFGFLPEPGSRVVFYNQLSSVVSVSSDHETFEDLYIHKSESTDAFTPQSKIWVNGNCRVEIGYWADAIPLNHKFHSDLFVGSQGHINSLSGGIWEFAGIEPQQIRIISGEDNHISTISMVGELLNINSDLMGENKINENLFINNGNVSVNAYTIEALQGIFVSSGASITSGEGSAILVGNILYVAENGEFTSSGTASDKAYVGSTGVGIQFGFVVDGNLFAENTMFENMDVNGLLINETGNLTNNLNGCSFISESASASLLTVNNPDTVTLSAIELNISVSLSQNSIRKNNGTGKVYVTDFDPEDADSFEDDPYGLIDWATTKSSELAKVESTSDLNPEWNINIFPNPCSDYFTIDFGTCEPIVKIVTLFDHKGTRVFSSSVTGDSGIIMTNELKKGLYLIKIVAGTNEITHKILVR